MCASRSKKLQNLFKLWQTTIFLTISACQSSSKPHIVEPLATPTSPYLNPNADRSRVFYIDGADLEIPLPFEGGRIQRTQDVPFSICNIEDELSEHPQFFVPENSPSVPANSFQILARSILLKSSMSTGCKVFRIQKDSQLFTLSVLALDPLAALAAQTQKVLDDAARANRQLTVKNAAAEAAQDMYGFNRTYEVLDDTSSENSNIKKLKIGTKEVLISEITSEERSQLQIALAAESAGLFEQRHNDHNTNLTQGAESTLNALLNSGDNGNQNSNGTTGITPPTSWPKPADFKSALGMTKVENWVGFSKMQRRIASLLWWGLSPVGHPRDITGALTQGVDRTNPITIPENPIDLISPLLSRLPASRSNQDVGRVILWNSICPTDPYLNGLPCNLSTASNLPSGNVIDRMLEFYEIGLKYGLVTGPIFSQINTHREGRASSNQSRNRPFSLPLEHINQGMVDTLANPEVGRLSEGNSWSALFTYSTLAEANNQVESFKRSFIQTFADVANPQPPYQLTPTQQQTALSKILNFVTTDLGFEIFAYPWVDGHRIDGPPQLVFGPGVLACPDQDPYGNWYVEITWPPYFDSPHLSPVVGRSSMVDFAWRLWYYKCYQAYPGGPNSTGLGWLEDLNKIARVRTSAGGGGVVEFNVADGRHWEITADAFEDETQSNQNDCHEDSSGRRVVTGGINSSPLEWFLVLSIAKRNPGIFSPSTQGTLANIAASQPLNPYWTFGVNGYSSGGETLGGSFATYFNSLKKIYPSLYGQMKPELSVFQKAVNFPTTEEIQTQSNDTIQNWVSELDSEIKTVAPFERMGAIKKVPAPTSAINQFSPVSDGHIKMIGLKATTSTPELVVVDKSARSLDCDWSDLNNSLMPATATQAPAGFLDKTFIPRVYVPGGYSVGCGWLSWRGFTSGTWPEGACHNVDHNATHEDGEENTCSDASDEQTTLCRRVEEFDCTDPEWTLDTNVNHYADSAYWIYNPFVPDEVQLCSDPSTYSQLIPRRIRSVTCTYRYDDGELIGTDLESSRKTHTEIQVPSGRDGVEVIPEVKHTCINQDIDCPNDNYGPINFSYAGMFPTGKVKVRYLKENAISCQNICDIQTTVQGQPADTFWKAYLGFYSLLDSNDSAQASDYKFHDFQSVAAIRSEQLKRFTPFQEGSAEYRNLLQIATYIKYWGQLVENIDRYQYEETLPSVGGADFYNSNLFANTQQVGLPIRRPFYPYASGGLANTFFGTTGIYMWGGDSGSGPHQSDITGQEEPEHHTTSMFLKSTRQTEINPILAGSHIFLDTFNYCSSFDDLHYIDPDSCRYYQYSQQLENRTLLRTQSIFGASSPMPLSDSIQLAFGSYENSGVPLKPTFGASLGFEPSVNDKVKLTTYPNLPIKILDQTPTELPRPPQYQTWDYSAFGAHHPDPANASFYNHTNRYQVSLQWTKRRYYGDEGTSSSPNWKILPPSHSRGITLGTKTFSEDQYNVPAYLNWLLQRPQDGFLSDFNTYAFSDFHLRYDYSTPDNANDPLFMPYYGATYDFCGGGDADDYQGSTNNGDNSNYTGNNNQNNRNGSPHGGAQGGAGSSQGPVPGPNNGIGSNNSNSENTNSNNSNHSLIPNGTPNENSSGPGTNGGSSVFGGGHFNGGGGGNGGGGAIPPNPAPSQDEGFNSNNDGCSPGDVLVDGTTCTNCMPNGGGFSDVCPPLSCPVGIESGDPHCDNNITCPDGSEPCGMDPGGAFCRPDPSIDCPAVGSTR